jgi:hypothetical protein
MKSSNLHSSFLFKCRNEIHIILGWDEATMRKITFVGVYMGKIGVYASGERYGPWASCSNAKKIL